MDKDIAAEVGKIAALVARLGYRMQLEPPCLWVWRPKYMDMTTMFDADCPHLVGRANITKTRKSRRIPMLRALADKLRAELKEQKK